MPANLTDVDTFTDPIVVPEPGDDRTAASVETAFQGLANRTRNLHNRVGNLHADPHAWTGAHSWDEDIRVDGNVLIDGAGGGEVLYVNDDFLALPRLRQIYGRLYPYGDWVRDAVFYAVSCELAGAGVPFELDDLPSGSRLVELAVLVRQGAGTTLGNGVRLQLWRVTPNGIADPALVAIPTTVANSETHEGTAATNQILKITCDEPVANGASFLMGNIVASNVAATGAKDVAYWWRASFTDPGPRNY